MSLTVPDRTSRQRKVDVALDDAKDQLINACDKALNDCAKANEDKKAVINQQDRVIIGQQNEIDELKKDQDSLWSKPWFTVTLGVVATLLTLIVSGHTR